VTVSAGAVLIVLVLLGASAGAPAIARVSSLAPAQSIALQDWPTYLGDNIRGSSTNQQSWLADSNASQLGINWSFTTGGIITSSTIVLDHIAYFGSGDGYEYAVNSSTGAVIWKTFLGIDDYDKACNNSLGITSAPTISNGVLYVGGNNATGGANATWYALSASTGAIQYGIPIGSMANGYYNWASPLIYDGYAYVGVASDCIKPLVIGGLMQVNLHAHLAKNFFHTTPFNTSTNSYELGASIWTSPSDDPLTNTIFVTTGNPPIGDRLAQEPYSEAVVALNASNISRNAAGTGPAPEAYWQVPQNQSLPDGDFGAGATVLEGMGPGKTDLVAAGNKNGHEYALNASNLASWAPSKGHLGTLWQLNTSTTTGQLLTPAAFGLGDLFFGTPSIKIFGVTYPGSIWAVNSRNGKVLWNVSVEGDDYGAPLYSNGVVVGVGGTDLYVLNATTGKLLNSWVYSKSFVSAPSIAEGRVFVGNENHEVYALCLASAACTITSPQP
jgi:outer membrane protein assembly factor BamB